MEDGCVKGYIQDIEDFRNLVPDNIFEAIKEYTDTVSISNEDLEFEINELENELSEANDDLDYANGEVSRLEDEVENLKKLAVEHTKKCHSLLKSSIMNYQRNYISLEDLFFSLQEVLDTLEKIED